MSASRDDANEAAPSSPKALPCCPPDQHPSKRAEELGVSTPLRGQTVILDGGTRAYFCEPRSSVKSLETGKFKDAVIVFHDIFGFGSARTHHICDEIAAQGDYLVIEPDCFGESIVTEPREFASLSVLQKFPNLVARYKYEFDYVQKIILDRVLPFIRQRANGKIGAVGFCWGTWAIMRLAGATDILSCGVGAHPTLHQQMFQRNGPGLDDLFRQTKIPMLFCPAWNDPASFREYGYYFRILREVQPKSQCVVFQNQLHGFANRSDLHNPRNKEDYDKFMHLAMDFLRSNMSGKSSVNISALDSNAKL